MLDVKRLQKSLPSVFTPTLPVVEAGLLYGRELLLRRMERAFRTPGKSIVTFGDRAVGKTSLCKVAAKSQKRETFYRSVGRGDTFDAVIDLLLDRFEIARSVEELERTEMAEKSAEIGIAKTGGRLGHGTKTRTLIRRHSLGLTPDQLAEKLSAVRGIAIIDDFEIMLEETRFGFSELIKKLSDHQAVFVLIVVGVAKRAGELIHNYVEVARHIDEIPVTPIDQRYLRRLIHDGLGQLEIAITPEAEQHILQRSLGFPHFVHQYCLDCVYELIDRIKAEEKDAWLIGTEEIELAEAFRATVG
jgi:hypothetical protein